MTGRSPMGCGNNGKLDLPLSQEEMLIEIAKNGPCDAYRTHKAIGMKLPTAQVAIKKLEEKGLISKRDTVVSEKQQRRILYGLRALGFREAVLACLKRSPPDYNSVSLIIKGSAPDDILLLKHWDEIIRKNPDLQDTWHQLLYKTLDCASSFETIDEEFARQIAAFNLTLSPLQPSDLKEVTEVLKEFPDLWDIVRFETQRKIDYFKEYIGFLSHLIS